MAARGYDLAVFEAIAPWCRSGCGRSPRCRPWSTSSSSTSPRSTDAWEKAWPRSPTSPALLADAAVAVRGPASGSADALHEVTLAVGERHGLKLDKAQAPIRVAVTGRTVGPPLFESLELLGRERTLERLQAARPR